MTVSLANPQMQSPDFVNDKGTISGFMNTLQLARIPVVENNVDKMLSISIPNRQMEEKKFIAKSNVLPVCGNSVDNLFKIVDSGRNLAVIATGLLEKPVPEAVNKLIKT